MESTGLFIGAVVIGAAYFFYRYGKKTMSAETVEELSIGDIAAFYKSKSLRKGIDVPFVATKVFFAKEKSLAKIIPEAPIGYNTIVLGVMNKETNKTNLEKIIFTKALDSTIAEKLKENGLVVLN